MLAEGRERIGAHKRWLFLSPTVRFKMQFKKSPGAVYLRQASRDLRTARKIVLAVELLCPFCEGTIPDPGGRLAWDVKEFGLNGKHCECPECKKKLNFPSV